MSSKRMAGQFSAEVVGNKKRCNLCGEYKPLSEFYKSGDKYRQECKTCYNIKRRENRTKKKHSDFVGGMKRRGESEVKYTHQEWKETVIYFEGRCAYCGCTMRKGERLTRDHLVPVSEGGATTQDNIVPACSRCNSSKGASDWREWFMRQPFFSQDRMNRIFKWRSIVRAAEGGERYEKD